MEGTFSHRNVKESVLLKKFNGERVQVFGLEISQFELQINTLGDSMKPSYHPTAIG